jgi:hypothetical protein
MAGMAPFFKTIAEENGKEKGDRERSQRKESE